MESVELHSLRHASVALPGSFGLSTEQTKRLTISVELIRNPSIIYMHKPTSALDARAIAILMRTVCNVIDTELIVVCTIHKPSIAIFLAFDELLLMNYGGRVIYGGKLGEKSQSMISYFRYELGCQLAVSIWLFILFWGKQFSWCVKCMPLNLTKSFFYCLLLTWIRNLSTSFSILRWFIFSAQITIKLYRLLLKTSKQRQPVVTLNSMVFLNIQSFFLPTAAYKPSTRSTTNIPRLTSARTVPAYIPQLIQSMRLGLSTFACS